ncbi:MAG: YceI family protein [Bacteroidetes bacterium]|nr:YceI family protein [Bacteroidota bacterium]
MKYLLIAFVITISSAFTLVVTTNHVETFSIDAEKSKVFWTGTRISGSHSGTINIKKGTVSIQHNVVVSANIIIDMTTIEEGKNNERLEGHLRSDDFFNIKEFPEASLITKKFVPIKDAGVGENNYEVTADLTIRGLTSEIKFPVSIYQSKGIWVMEGSLIFDRSKYNIRFGSTSFFEGLGDKAISNDVVLRFSVITHKTLVEENNSEN